MQLGLPRIARFRPGVEPPDRRPTRCVPRVICRGRAPTKRGEMSHQRNCPRCHRSELDPTRNGSVEIDACVHCGGRPGSRSGRLEQAVGEAIGTSASLSDDLAVVASRKDATGLACPACAGQLICYEFPNLGDVELDVCESCQGVLARSGRIAARSAWARSGTHPWQHHLAFVVVSVPALPTRRVQLASAAFSPGHRVVGGDQRAADRGAAAWRRARAWRSCRWGLIPGQLLAGKGVATLLTHAFLHGSLLHLAFNMYFLYILGDNVEDVLGRAAICCSTYSLPVVGCL